MGMKVHEETALYAVGSQPLDGWRVHHPEGSVERIMDDELKRSVIDIRGNTVATTYVNSPKLAIKFPHAVFLIKSLGADVPCGIELEVLDSKDRRRRFRAATYQKRVTSDDKVTAMPLKLEAGWNHVQFDLGEFLRRWYGTSYVETVGIQVNATCRVRRIYFTDSSYDEGDLDDEYRLAIVDASGPTSA